MGDREHEDLIEERPSPTRALVLFFDEPHASSQALEIGAGGTPLEHEAAIDVLSGGSLAAPRVPDRQCTSAAPGDRRLALEAGPQDGSASSRASKTSSTTPGARPSISTPTVGSPGARSRPTGPSASRWTRCGTRSSPCGAS